MDDEGVAVGEFGDDAVKDDVGVEPALGEVEEVVRGVGGGVGTQAVHDLSHAGVHDDFLIDIDAESGEGDLAESAFSFALRVERGDSFVFEDDLARSWVFGEVHRGGFSEDGSVWGDEWLEDEGCAGGYAVEFELGVGDGSGFGFPEVWEEAGEINPSRGGGDFVRPFFGCGIVEMEGDFSHESFGDIDLDGDALTNSEVQAFGRELGDRGGRCGQEGGQECEQDQQQSWSAGGVHRETVYRMHGARRTLRGLDVDWVWDQDSENGLFVRSIFRSFNRAWSAVEELPRLVGVADHGVFGAGGDRLEDLVVDIIEPLDRKTRSEDVESVVVVQIFD